MNKVFTAALLASVLAAGTALAQSTTNSTTNSPAMGTTNSATGSGMATGGAATTNSVSGTGTSNTSTTTTTNTSTTPPAIATPGVDSQTKAAPVAGANSFTKGQARDRLEAHGYTNVTDLKLDDQQIWRGKAMKNGTQVNVALDYQGNIVSQ